MTIDLREKLASQQGALVLALAGLTSSPEGFNAAQLQTTSAALARKRMRAAAKAWPELSEAIGNDFEPLFEEFALTQPAPHTAGPAADGFEFAAYLQARKKLTADGQKIWLELRLRYRSTREGLRLRRGIGLAADRLHDSNKVLMALRIGSTRTWRFSIPLIWGWTPDKDIAIRET